MSKRIFGHIAGYPEGSGFDTRAELSEVGLHKPRMAGVSGSIHEGVDSIILSGGYEDDEDYGATIIYTGAGGRDRQTGRQIANQTLTKYNLAFVYTKLHGLPVRLIRGHTQQSVYAPRVGYRYDGLYRVEDYWHTIGRSGYTIWRFRLVKIEGKDGSLW